MHSFEKGLKIRNVIVEKFSDCVREIRFCKKVPKRNAHKNVRPTSGTQKLYCILCEPSKFARV